MTSEGEQREFRLHFLRTANNITCPRVRAPLHQGLKDTHLAFVRVLAVHDTKCAIVLQW